MSYPSAGGHEEVASIDDGPDSGQNQADYPDENHQDDKQSLGDHALGHQPQERMDCDGDDKHPARDITNLDEPTLGEAGAARRRDAVCDEPVEGQQEAERLLHVGQQEVVDQDKDLTRGDGRLIVTSPVDHAVGDEDEEGERGEEGEEPEESDGYHAIANLGGEMVGTARAIVPIASGDNGSYGIERV